MRRPRALAPLFLAVLFAGGIYLWLGDKNLNMADEGFLWYGVVQTRAGEVPMRDFQAYDPGRYYWCAAWSFVFGSGILGVRAAGAVFQALGLAAGLAVCARFTRSLAGLALCAAILAAWMFPRHKLFEPALALVAVWIGARVVEDPAPRRLLAAGVFTGLAAWFGRNHALYLVLGFSALAAYLTWKRALPAPFRAARAFVLGALAGSAPLWGMLLLVPGFAAGYAESLRLIARHGANLPEPYLWPWRVELAGKTGLELLGSLALALAYLLPVVVYPLGLLVALRTPRHLLAERAVPLAAAIVGVFYAHHASVRSDAVHLAQSIHPALVLALALPATLSARALARVLTGLVLSAVTLFAVFQASPSFIHLRSGARSEAVEVDVAGEALRLVPAQAAMLRGIQAAVSARVAPEEALFIAPARPTLYPVLGKKSPVWWLYFFWPASAEEEAETIRRLDATPVNWALIVEHAVEERAERGFRSTHPRVWQHLADAFRPVPDERLPPGHHLFRRKDP
jgi:hypothetical protein